MDNTYEKLFKRRRRMLSTEEFKRLAVNYQDMIFRIAFSFLKSRTFKNRRARDFFFRLRDLRDLRLRDADHLSACLRLPPVRPSLRKYATPSSTAAF